MKQIFSIILIIFFGLSVTAQSKDEIEIKQVLHAQQEAWNAGSVDDFMKGYWQSDSLMFIETQGINYGWQQALDHYKKHYPDTATMGKLSFEILKLKPIDDLNYFIIGKWHLKRSIGDVGGIFTLLFKKIKGKWLIIADHTS